MSAERGLIRSYPKRKTSKADSFAGSESSDGPACPIQDKPSLHDRIKQKLVLDGFGSVESGVEGPLDIFELAEFLLDVRRQARFPREGLWERLVLRFRLVPRSDGRDGLVPQPP